jgi:hypothetical protein
MVVLSFLQPLRRASCAIVALLLAGIWIPVSAHDWLEAAGWIHNRHEDAGPAHEAADGLCRLDHGTVHIASPVWLDFSALAWASPAAIEPRADPEIHRWILARDTAPPGLAVTWQFLERAALPSLAPTPSE